VHRREESFPRAGRGSIVRSEAELTSLVRRWVSCDWLRVVGIAGCPHAADACGLSHASVFEAYGLRTLPKGTLIARRWARTRRLVVVFFVAVADCAHHVRRDVPCYEAAYGVAANTRGAEVDSGEYAGVGNF